MKKFVGIFYEEVEGRMLVLLAFVMFACPLMAEDITAVSTDAVAATAEVTSGWMHTIGLYAEIIMKIISVPLGLLLMFAVNKIKEKWGVETAAVADDVLSGLLDSAIAYANGWAKKQSGKPSGQEKLQKALDYIAPKLEELKIPTILKDKLSELIEERLLILDK